MLAIALLLAAAASAELAATVEKVTVNTPDAAKPAETADAAERRQAALKAEGEADAGNTAENATAERRQAELEEKEDEGTRREMFNLLENLCSDDEKDEKPFYERLKEEVDQECQDCFDLGTCLIVEQATPDFGGLTVSHWVKRGEGGVLSVIDEDTDKKKFCVKPFDFNEKPSYGYLPKNVSERCGDKNQTGPSILFQRQPLPIDMTSYASIMKFQCDQHGRNNSWISVFESKESCCLAYKATYQFFKKVYPEKDEKAVAEVDRMRFEKGTKTKLKDASCGDLEELTKGELQTREELKKISGKVDAFQKILEATIENDTSFGKEGYFRHAVNYMKSFKPDEVVKYWDEEKKGHLSELSTAYALPGEIGCAGAGSYGVIFDPLDMGTEILLAAPEDLGLTSQEMSFKGKIASSINKLNLNKAWTSKFFLAKEYESLEEFRGVTLVNFSDSGERKNILNGLKLPHKRTKHTEVVINTDVSKIAGVFVDEKAAGEVGYRALELKQLLDKKQNTKLPFYLVAKDGTLKGVQL